MTELRDARLRKALDEAPDAGLQPQARTREAIRAAAHDAVQPAWRRWWPRGDGSRVPWTAALATIALATLVTVMWQGRGIPGAGREPAGADTVAVAPQPAPVPAPAPGPAPAAAPEIAPAPAPAAAPAPAPLPRPQAAPAPARPPAVAREAAPERDTGARQERAPTLPPLRDAAPGIGSDTLARSAPSEESRAAAAAPPPPPAVAAAPGPAPLPAPAAAPQRQAAPAAPAAALRAAPASLPWTQVRIEAGGRSVVVARMQAGELPALITSMLASPSDEADASAAGSLKLELAQGDEAAGVLDLVGERWRWTPLRDARQARLLRADPAVAESLRREAQRLLRR